MLSNSKLKNMKLGISPIDDRTGMIINAGIEWLEQNTTITPADIPNNSSAKLFLSKFYELQNMRPGVASESIEGLSQSFNTGNINDLLWQLAEELLGQYLTGGKVRFVAATRRWD